MIYHTAAFELAKGDTVLMLGMPLTVATVRPASNSMFVALNDADGKRFKEMFVNDLFQFEVTHFASEMDWTNPELALDAEYSLGLHLTDDDSFIFDEIGFNSNDGVFAVAEDMEVAA